MRLAVQDVLLPGDDPVTKPGMAAGCGFEFIEYRYPNLESCWREVGKALDDAPVELRTIDEFPFRRLAVPDASHAERLGEARRAIDVAAELGAEVVTTIGALGEVAAEFESDRMLGTYLESLQELATTAADNGITLAIEPLNRYETSFVNTLAEAVDMARRVDRANVEIMAEFFHLNLEEADMAESLRAAGAAVAHVHLADSNRRLPGRGHLDMGPGLRALEEDGYAGVMTLECCIGERWRGLGYFDGDYAAELRWSRTYLEGLGTA